jgi:YaiO family outer membrane protein
MKRSRHVTTCTIVGKAAAAVLLLTLFFHPSLHAAGPVGTDQPVESVQVPADRSVSITMGGDRLSNGYGQWQNVKLNARYSKADHVWQAELSSFREFGQSGRLIGLGDTVTLSPNDYFSGAISVGDGAFYLPKVRVDVTAFRKWRADKNLVTSVGWGHYEAPDGHTDRTLNLGGVWYFEQPWIVEGGVRVNRSNPGSIKSVQRFVAVTQGRNREDVYTVRYGWGGEGYQSTGIQTLLVNFKSQQLAFTWRHWVNANSGMQWQIERYRNPYYRRNGLSITFFHDFQ